MALAEFLELPRADDEEESFVSSSDLGEVAPSWSLVFGVRGLGLIMRAPTLMKLLFLSLALLRVDLMTLDALLADSLKLEACPTVAPDLFIIVFVCD